MVHCRVPTWTMTAPPPVTCNVVNQPSFGKQLGQRHDNLRVSSQVVKEDALSDASLDGDSIILLMHLNWKVGRHIHRVCGVLNPACQT